MRYMNTTYDWQAWYNGTTNEYFLLSPGETCELDEGCELLQYARFKMMAETAINADMASKSNPSHGWLSVPRPRGLL